jgi:hypothetical protein
LYSYTFKVEDPDAGDPINLSATIKPKWLNFTWTTGAKQALLSGTPLNSNVGDTTVRLRVTDGQVVKYQTYTLHVLNVNDTPVITSTPQTSVNEDVSYSYTLTVTDEDVSDVITMSVVTKPDWLTFTWTAGSKTATLTGTPGNDNTGDNPIDISITDNTATIHEAYLLTVNPVNDPPEISAIRDISIDEDNSVTLQLSDLTVTDIDNPPTDLSLIIQAGNDYSFVGTVVTPDANFNGDLVVNLVVRDLVENSATFQAHITVNPINDPPVITSTPELTGYVGNLYAYVLTATDVDNASLTKSVIQKPDWLQFLEATGVLTGTPAQADKGQHLVILRVSDGTTDVDQDFVIDVDGPSAINSNDIENLKFYPVPANDHLYVELGDLSETSYIQIMNSAGFVMKTVTVPAGTKIVDINTRDLNAGFYFCRITSNSDSQIFNISVTK